MQVFIVFQSEINYMAVSDANAMANFYVDLRTGEVKVKRNLTLSVDRNYQVSKFYHTMLIMEFFLQ